MEEDEDKTKKRKKFGIHLKIKIILSIILGVMAFILIVTAAWKQELLKITSGSINKNKTIQIANNK